MKTLEERCEEMELELARLKGDVRLKRVAESFPESDIRPGDCFLTEGSLGRLSEIKPDGKWLQVVDGHCWEGRPAYNPERLYTHAEVDAILAERLSR